MSLGTGTNIEKLDLLKKDFPNVDVIKFDISDHSKIEEFIDNASTQLTGLDILINNAGTNMDNLSLRMKDEEWKKVIDINLTSTFLLSKYAIKKMLKNKYGRIVNIASVVGHTGNLGTIKLCRIKSRNYRYDQIFGNRICKKKDYIKLRFTWIYTIKNDRQHY